MNDYAFYITGAYAVAAVTIGGMTMRIVLDYRRLRRELACYGAAGQRDDGGAA